ncbi:MAG TPA: alpha/beta fold hydrolase [Aliiroseovarius sp.]|nr:alpha/beta fold hydrolase [Aliiroseovarius sp.]
MLQMTTYGDDATRPPVLIVHGLFGSGRNWRAIARRMARTRRVVTVDMRNHGSSPWADSQSYPDMAADLAEMIGMLGGQADVLGHSMGGKAAMVLALHSSELVRRLLVADIAPVAYAHSQSHLVDAMQGLDLKQFTTRSMADAALENSIETPEVRAFLLQSLDLEQHRWRLNLDVLARDMGLITGFPDISGRFDGPALFLSGAESDYVLPAYRARIKELFPHARFAKIPGAGHWLHAERPRAFIAAAEAFLNS